MPSIGPTRPAPESVVPLHALRQTPSDPERDRAPSVDADGRTRDRRRKVLSCRRCKTEIADVEDVFGLAGKPAVQVHTNPAGLVFEIITVSAARNLVTVGSASTVFTWFPGYAWEIVCCAGCSTHLGWRFTQSGDGIPACFYGLLRQRLAG